MEQLGRRSFPEIPWKRVRMSPFRELVRLMAQRVPSGVTSARWRTYDDVFVGHDRRVASYISRVCPDDVRLLYAYEHSALNSLKAARGRGIASIYELTSLYWRRAHALLNEETELQPEWSSSLIGLDDNTAAQKDDELAAASHVIVASQLGKRWLTEAFGSSIRVSVIPYGAPEPLVSKCGSREDRAPLRILFAGHVTQNKGASYLVSALRQLEVPWELVLVGTLPPNVPEPLVQFLESPRCSFIGHISHRRLLTVMAHSHVLVVPSLLEGFGLVISEAMAAGLPVVATANTAAADLFEDGVDGFVIPIRDAEAITGRLTLLYESEDLRRQIGNAALAKAARCSWARYGAAVADIANETIGRANTC
jgi:alpha-maltose-1-phosphate synthase